MVAPLEQVLLYENDEVIRRFMKNHGVSLPEAQEIFTETKRWLWFAAQRSPSDQLPLFNDGNPIDLMWHTFLLFTFDYAQFCQKYFGKFVHHYPRLSAEVQEFECRMQENPEKLLQEHKQVLKNMYELIHDELGADVLIRWCEEYPERFSNL